MDLALRLAVAAVSFAAVRIVAGRWPQRLVARDPAPVVALTLVATLGAVLAPGAATGLAGADAILRATFAAAVTAAAARARRRVWLVASTATVAAGSGAALDWLAFVATGVTLAMLVLGRRSWAAGATIGACLSQVLLRLDLGGPTGTTAAVAALLGGMLVVSGLRGSGRTVRRRAWLTAGALAGVTVVVSAAAALAAASAAGDVRDGIDAGDAGVAAARQGQVPAAAERFGLAADAFARAGGQLGRWWVRPAQAVPVVGRQLRAARILSAAGEDLAGAASVATYELDLRGLRLERGGIDLAAVERAAGALGSARRALERAGVDVGRARSPWLLPPLAEAVGDLDRRVSEARRDIGTAADVLDLAGPMLGRDGPRRYLLVVVTPAENRGSGGLVGNFGEITAVEGKLGLQSVARIARLNETVDDAAAAGVLPELYAAAYGGWNVPAKLQNATVAADFPTAATALESVLPLAGRGEVDGTVSIDPLAVAALLDVVGPVRVPSWPVEITAGNAAAVLLHEQYVALAGEARENFLGEVIFAVWERVTGGSLPAPAGLAAALAPAVRGRHIQFHSRRTEEQAALGGRLSADGALHRTAGHYLAVVANNASESKADWFLRRSLQYNLHYDPGAGSAEARVSITLTNEAPDGGLPAYVLGGGLAPPGHNRQIVQLYTPFDLVSATVDGRPPPAALRSLGRPGEWAHELDVVVAAKSSTVIELRLAGELPTAGGIVSLEVGRQPAVHPDDVTVTITAPGSWRVAGAGGGFASSGSAVTARLTLDRNRHLATQFRRN